MFFFLSSSFSLLIFIFSSSLATATMHVPWLQLLLSLASSFSCFFFLFLFVVFFLLLFLLCLLSSLFSSSPSMPSVVGWVVEPRTVPPPPKGFTCRREKSVTMCGSRGGTAGVLDRKDLKVYTSFSNKVFKIYWEKLWSRLNPLLQIWETRYIKWITNIFLINFLISTKLAWFLNSANPISFFPPSFIDSSMHIPHVRV